MNKKGFIGDVPTTMIYTFIGAVTFLIVLTILSIFNSSFQADSNIPQAAKNISSLGITEYSNLGDGFMALILIGIPLIAAGLIYYLDSESIFFWILGSLLAVFVIGGAVFGWLWEKFTTNTILETYVTQMPITNYVLSNFAMYSLFITVILMAGLFFKWRGNQY